jgi:hypothetical protein
VSAGFAIALVAAPASAASPSPAASCVAQFNQAGTPNGFAQMPPGFVGAFVSSEATSGPGVVGAGSSALAGLHGDLFACLP